MSTPLAPAQLALRDDGTPYSPLFDDVYHSAVGGIGQALHVFIGGNRLPDNWRARRVFSIVETGFGLGLNFVMTWSEWRRDPARCERLHFVSAEKHPFRRDDLRVLLATALGARPDLAPLAQQLVDAWPTLVAGVHRLTFDDARVTLTLAFGDALELLPKLGVRADAFYLDGFSPAKNEDLWSPRVFKALAKMADHGATFATYTSSGKVKSALTDAGFTYRKVRGYAAKRDMLVGEFAPAYRVRRHEPPARFDWPERRAIVVGAGLAGCAIVERLAARGWSITLLERRDAPAAEASGNPAGVFHPMIARVDTPAARLSRAGFLYALRRWKALAEAGHPLNWSTAGLLQLAHDDNDAMSLRQAIDSLGLPDDFARAVDRQCASALAGVDVARGGAWFARGGWIDPASLCRAQLDAARAANGTRATFDARFGVGVERLDLIDGRWHAFDTTGAVLAAAPVAIVANAHDAARLAGLRCAPTRAARGQLTMLPGAPLRSLRVPVIGDGYVLALDAERAMTGATYEMDDDDMTERHAGHAENLERLGALLPGLAGRFDPRVARGRVGLRCVVSDRLPMAGALADEACPLDERSSASGAQLADLRRRPGLYGAFAYGSRGLVWAAICAELLASQIDAEPWPIERDLACAIDPARYLLRSLRTTAQRR